MANFDTRKLITTEIAEIHNNLYKSLLKIHKLTSSIGFIGKCLYFKITPTFAKVKGNFANKHDKYAAERSILKAQLTSHKNELRKAIMTLESNTISLSEVTNLTYTNFLIRKIRIQQRHYRTISFQTKNSKIANLLPTRRNTDSYQVPVINLSNVDLNERESQQLKLGLEHCFVDKNKYVKRNLANSFESLADKVNKGTKEENKEKLHELLRSYTDIFSNNIYKTRDYTYCNLRRLSRNEEVVVVSGDKDSCVVLMNKSDYVEKLQNMIDDGIENKVYELTTDETLSDLQQFQSFLYRNFFKYEHYEDMWPTSNQPARIYATAKTHKFENLADINIEDLKFRPIIAQTGTYTYKAAQVIGKYLQPLVKDNRYIIRNTQDFPKILKSQPQLEDDEEYVSYDVESLFTNIPIKDTIDYIVQKIYVENKLPIICTQLIFTRLLEKLTTESTFIFQGKFYKQCDGCTMGGPLSVILSDIFMSKLEEEVVIPREPKFYRRFVDDSFTIRKKNVPDDLFTKMNEYKPDKIRFTIESKPSKFLDTKVIVTNSKFETEMHHKIAKLPPHWSSKTPKRYKRNAINGALHRAYRISSNFEKEVNIIRDKYTKAGYPLNFVNSVIKSFRTKINEETIIPEFLFKEPKTVCYLEVPFCFQNEKVMHTFLKKFHSLTESKFELRIKWQTKKIKTLFRLKDPNPYPACVIYEGTCNTCGVQYIGETERNAVTRWAEHDNPKKSSEPARHLKRNPSHKFEWKILCRASKIDKDRKNLEACFIAYKKPSLNNKVESNSLVLFRNGIG